MDPWGAVGMLWDRAFDGDPEWAAGQAKILADERDDSAERAILVAAQALCEIVACRYADGTITAARASILARDARGPLAEDARYFCDGTRLLAAAMIEPEPTGVDPKVELPRLAELQEYALTIDASRPERLLLAMPVIEATMASGEFSEVDRLVTGLRPFTEADDQHSTVIRATMDAVFARSLAFRGDLDALVDECSGILDRAAGRRQPQVVMLAEALLCYAAGQRADRNEVELRSARVLTTAHGRANYVAVGSSLLVTWAFSAIGQIQRAAALVVAASGGPHLPRIKTWDRAFGYELLVTAALRRGDLTAARSWAALAEPLAARPVAAAAVERTLSRVAVAAGDHADAVHRAAASARLDALSGAKLDGLRGRVLHASALASTGDHARAELALTQIAAEADKLGAASVRKLATQEWRALTKDKRASRGGFASLSDREREIAVLVAEGHTNRSIGITLFLSERTVQTHLSHILSVLGLPSRTAMPAALGIDIGIGSTTPDAPTLTERQEQIAQLIARGHPNSVIASELGISVKTVENHLAVIFTKWQVSSRTAVANMLVARDRASL